MYGSYIHRTNTKIKVDFQPSRIQVQPNTPYTAKFCIPYCIAHAVLSGEVKPNMFEPAVLFDNSIREFMKKVDIYPSQEMDALYPATRASKVEIITKSNESFHTTIYKPKGDPENPLDIGELKEKFVSLTKARVRQSLGKQNASRPLIQKGSEAFGHTSGVYLGARVDA
ncbi:MmgE/PrpD family protein [Geobacillus subterraneus]|uniref:MmgE/PrpD family protein n=1 Tax=Geobacillus subterraneus TaxID=129338 RepID=UPI001442DC84|nr:MmgE/PrpD family protein [Geobacillus subterraneus]QIZ66977.1 MmgE/PrpD family protein [Geobacillus subterraneus]